MRASPDGRQPRCKECQRVLSQNHWEAKGRQLAAEKAKTPKISPKRKTCVDCGQFRQAQFFYKRNASKDGLDYLCKDCRNSGNKQWKDANPEKVQAMVREGAKRAHLKRSYGITYEEYLAMSEEQNDVCAICKEPETKISKNGEPGMLSVDHNHETGQVRRLLCHSCNWEVGVMEKFIREPEREQRLRTYLEVYSKED